jgi:hypothetical protein
LNIITAGTQRTQEYEFRREMNAMAASGRSRGNVLAFEKPDYFPATSASLRWIHEIQYQT